MSLKSPSWPAYKKGVEIAPTPIILKIETTEHLIFSPPFTLPGFFLNCRWILQAKGATPETLKPLFTLWCSCTYRQASRALLVVTQRPGLRALFSSLALLHTAGRHICFLFCRNKIKIMVGSHKKNKNLKSGAAGKWNLHLFIGHDQIKMFFHKAFIWNPCMIY